MMTAGAAAGPINDWCQWEFKKVACVFSNTALVTLNGHAIPAFATNLFDEKTKLYLYGDTDGKVFGVGNITMQAGDREAMLNLEAKGSLSTKGQNPYLAFTVSGKGPGAVGAQSGMAILSAKFVQTKFLTIPAGLFGEEHYAEGTIAGKVKQPGGAPLDFEDTIRIRLDDIARQGTAYLVFDITETADGKLKAHSHGTNNCFGRYESSPVEMPAKGVCHNDTTGEFVLETGGKNYLADGIHCKVTGQLESAAPGSRIDITNAQLKGKAYGQKLNWTGYGAAAQNVP